MATGEDRTVPAFAAALKTLGLDPVRAGEVDTAVDVLLDAGFGPEQAVELALAAVRGGRAPEATARHLVKLRHALPRG